MKKTKPRRFQIGRAWFPYRYFVAVRIRWLRATYHFQMLCSKSLELDSSSFNTWRKNGHLHCLLDEHPLPIFYNLQINFFSQSVSQCSFQRQERLQSWVSLNWTIRHQIAHNQSCIVRNFLPQAVPKSGCQVYWTHSTSPPNSSRWECCQDWSRGLWCDDDIFIIIISFSSPVCSSFFFLFPLYPLFEFVRLLHLGVSDVWEPNMWRDMLFWKSKFKWGCYI